MAGTYLAFDDASSDSSSMVDQCQSPHPREVDENPGELAWDDFYESLSEGFLPRDITEDPL